MSVPLQGFVSADNSSVVFLANAGVFTGLWEDCSPYASVAVTILSDQAGTLEIDFSPDKTNPDVALTYAVAASVPLSVVVPVVEGFSRTKFTNSGGSTQTVMRLQTILSNQSSGGSVGAGSADSGTTRVVLAPATSGGYTISKTLSAATTNATSVKASAGQVYGWYVSNINASPAYFKLYNKASAPTVGTDVPVMTITIPGNATGAGSNINWVHGIAFATGIAFAITTGATTADTGAVALNEVIINLLYK